MLTGRTPVVFLVILFRNLSDQKSCAVTFLIISWRVHHKFIGSKLNLVKLFAYPDLLIYVLNTLALKKEPRIPFSPLSTRAAIDLSARMWVFFIWSFPSLFLDFFIFTFSWYIVSLQLIISTMVNDDRKRERKRKSMHCSITRY